MGVTGILLLLLPPLAAAPADPAEFDRTVRPVLMENCGGCHNPKNPKNRTDFLKAETAADIDGKRGMWRSVAAQLRNRTMPPVASKLTEEDRFHIAKWVEQRLRDTACSTGAFAAAAPPRRLNRREYRNTVRDLLGVDLPVTELFPADESGGAGFDTNAETLYIPPILIERYVDAAQKALDRAIVTPTFNRVYLSPELEPARPSDKPGRPMQPKEELTAAVSLYASGVYNLRVSVERPRQTEFFMELKVDGEPLAEKLVYRVDPGGGATARIATAKLERGRHTISVVAGDEPVQFYSLTVEHKQPEITADQRTLHFRLFGLEPGETPDAPRESARSVLERFTTAAYRRPLQPGELDRLMAIYDRGAKRGDPFEESVKLALRAVLTSPFFLFRVEDLDGSPGVHPLGQYQMASRLSYFLWSTMPDSTLFQLAAEGKLQDPAVLAQQVERMLNDPRSRAFSSAFVGQWLNSQEVGGRVVPLLTELQHYYTPEIAADLRQEPVLLYHHILTGNRSLLELLTANYTFLTERLVRFYQVEGKVKRAPGDGFQRTEWPDDRRAGVLGMASVLAQTSHYRQTSPVLRGAWVLETLLGTPTPPPPPDVPPLPSGNKSEKGLSMRQILLSHRANPACATCHNLMDPIGFGLENFDWMGRWREVESNGEPLDTSGVLPSGEKFNGVVELRKALLNHRREFIQHLVSKTLGYALGRGLQDGDFCTVQTLADSLEANGYEARRLIREIVLSTPFRNYDPGAIVVSEHGPKKKRAPLLGEK